VSDCRLSEITAPPAIVALLSGQTAHIAVTAARRRAHHLGPTPVVIDSLGEKDRSATGYVPKIAVERVIDTSITTVTYGGTGDEGDVAGHRGHGGVLLAAPGLSNQRPLLPTSG
jgi:hypothetical protein